MELKDLQERYSDAIAVKEMMATPGWKVVEKHLDLIYSQNLVKLVAAENPEARLACQGITLVRNALTNIISQGIRSHNEIKHQEGK